MKTLLLLLFALAGSALAQTTAPLAPALAPELAPLAAKHQADLATIEKQRAAALAPYLPAYFTRLDAEEKNALNHGDIAAVAAVGSPSLSNAATTRPDDIEKSLPLSTGAWHEERRWSDPCP